MDHNWSLVLPFVQKHQSQQCFLKLMEQTGFWAVCVAVKNRKRNKKNSKDIYALLINGKR